jgi:hypothetical protein
MLLEESRSVWTISAAEYPDISVEANAPYRNARLSRFHFESCGRRAPICFPLADVRRSRLSFGSAGIHIVWYV